MNESENRRDGGSSWREERREAKRRWREERWKNRDYQDLQRSGSVWTGIFIIMIGLAFLIRNSVPGIPGWVFSWPAFLLALGFFVGIRHNFQGAAWFVLMVVGGVFLIGRASPELHVQKYMWPFALIVIGLFFVIRPSRRHRLTTEKKTPDITAGPSETWSDEDYVESTSIFGGAKKNIISKKFKGGDLVNIFGGTDLDLTQADFSGKAVIELTTIFGGTKLIIPSNWAIQSDAVIIFGGLEDKRKMAAPTGEHPDKVLVLKGTVVFGGIDIKSY